MGVAAGARIAGTLVGVGLGIGIRGVVAGVRWWRGQEMRAGRMAYERSPEPQGEAEGWRDPWDVWDTEPDPG